MGNLEGGLSMPKKITRAQMPALGNVYKSKRFISKMLSSIKCKN